MSNFEPSVRGDALVSIRLEARFAEAEEERLALRYAGIGGEFESGEALGTMLREEVFKRLPEATRVDVFFARGSLLVQILAEVPMWALSNIAWEVVRSLAHHLAGRLRTWLNTPTEVVINIGIWTPPPPPATGQRLAAFDIRTIGLIAMAALSQLTLVFVVVWLLVH